MSDAVLIAVLLAAFALDIGLVQVPASAVRVPSGEADPPGLGWAKVRTRPAAALLEPEILHRALLQSFVKLDPWLMITGDNPLTAEAIAASSTSRC